MIMNYDENNIQSNNYRSNFVFIVFFLRRREISLKKRNREANFSVTNFLLRFD